jgi:PPK2 family polyphosphate:nucleotide phosphotransferase
MPVFEDVLSELRVRPGAKVSLSKLDAGRTLGLEKESTKQRLEELRAEMAELQELMYADRSRGLLIVLQGMDTSGKDGTVKNVMGGVDPHGCRVTAFKAPTEEERAHDFLWRIHRAVPPRGFIGIFNRSHYEDVLIARVRGLVPEKVWKERYALINAFESLIDEGGVTVLKFYLHISKDEQRERLQARVDDPHKHWKFNPADLKERERWDEYEKAYEDALEKCSTERAPWTIVPANKKWVRNIVVAETVVRTMRAMKLQWPKAEFDPKGVVVK